MLLQVCKWYAILFVKSTGRPGKEVKMAGKSRGSSGKGKYRSAITGKYVTAKYGKSHPKNTVKESK